MCCLNSSWCSEIRRSVTAISSETHKSDTSHSKCHCFLRNVTGWSSGSNYHLFTCQPVSSSQKHQLAIDSCNNVTSLMKSTCSACTIVSTKVCAFPTTVHLPFDLQKNSVELINQLSNVKIICSNPLSFPPGLAQVLADYAVA